MGFLQSIFETKAASSPSSSASIARATGASSVTNGIGIGPVGPWDIDNALKGGYERVIWIYRCVDVIAQNQASLQINLVTGLNRTVGKREIVEDQRLDRLLNYKANTYESSWMFRYRLSSQLLLSRKGAFIEILRGRDGRPSELHLLPPQKTEPIPDATKFVSGFKVERSDWQTDTLEPEDVIWVRLKPHPTDPYQQMTPLVAAGIEADTDFLARIFNRTFLANDGRPGMLITIDPGVNPLDPVDAENIKARFNGGPARAGETTVIEAVGINAQDLSATPRDVQWESLLGTTKERLLMAFGVPESVMGNASGRTFDNADAERENFWLDTELTHCNSIAYALDPLSDTTSDDKVFAFDYENVEVLQRMAMRKREEWRGEFKEGLRTVDEYLVACGKDPWNRLETRILIHPNGVFTGKDNEDSEAAKKIVPIAAAPAQPQGGAMPPSTGPDPYRQFAETTRSFTNDIAARAAAISGRKSSHRAKEVKAAPLRAIKGGREDDDQEAVREVDIERITFESYLVGILDAWDGQQQKVIPARLDHAKVRKGTRHWETKDDIDVELKALNAAYIVEIEQWINQLRDAMDSLIHKHVSREMTKAVTALKRLGILPILVEKGRSSGKGYGAEPAFPDPFTAQVASNLIYMNAMKVVDNAASRQNAKVLSKITELDSQGASLTEIKTNVRKMIGARGAWRRRLATNIATSVTEGAKDAVYGVAKDLMVAEWQTHEDERVRASHRALDKKKRPETGAWATPEGPIRFPGDPLAPPSLTVNCRCWIKWTPDFERL